jgi:hypothetical protein
MFEIPTSNTALLANIHAALPKLEKLLTYVDGEWVSEDLVYRFWHHSFKVFFLQDATVAMDEALRALTPNGGSINQWYDQIVADGTGKTFSLEMNADWLQHTKPIVDAFFHVRFMLDMAVKCGRELSEAPTWLPSGWAALLELYMIR